MSSHKSQLTREKIAAVALAIADKEGFEAVSMRRVAHELNAGTMSLYYYVKTKDDLIAADDLGRDRGAAAEHVLEAFVDQCSADSRADGEFLDAEGFESGADHHAGAI